MKGEKKKLGRFTTVFEEDLPIQPLFFPTDLTPPPSPALPPFPSTAKQSFPASRAVRPTAEERREFHFPFFACSRLSFLNQISTMDMWGRKIPVNWKKKSVEVDSHTFLFHSFDVLVFAGDEQVQQAVRGSAEGDPGEVEAGPGAAAAAEGSRRQEEGPAQGGAGAAAAEGAGAAPAAAAAEGGRGGQCGGGGRGGRRGGRRGEAVGGSAAARRFIQVRRFRAGKPLFP